MATVIDSSLFHSMREEAAESWSIQLQKQLFSCSIVLAKQLKLTSNNVSLSQFLALCDKSQTHLLKQAIKTACEQGLATQLHLIFSIDKQRYLAECSIEKGEAGTANLHGHLKLLQCYLSHEQETTLLKTLFNETKNGLMVADINHHILMVNKEFCRETEFTEMELLGTHAGVIKSSRYDSDFYSKLWDAVNQHGYWEGELLAQTKHGNSYAHHALIKRIMLANNMKVYATTTRKLDVSLAALSNQQAIEPHIRLPDKKAFSAELERLYQSLPSNQTIVCIAFNANMSSSISDDMKAWLISQRFDSMAFNGFLGQINPSLYGLCWCSEKKVDIINTTLWSIIRRLVGTRKDDALKLAPVMTVGCSVLALDATSPKQLLAHAIQSLIANQQQLSSTLYYFDRRLSHRFERVTVLTKLLDNALQAERIEVFYQPIVTLPGLKVVKFEALFRTHLDTGMEYSTQELIQIAEKNLWIDRIDATVARQALQDLPKLQRHFNNPNLEMSINRSLHNDLVSQSCLEETLQILSYSGADLNNVTLELTESAFFQDLTRQKQWINKLSKIGVKIAIDDFGTGYSSFSYLLNLPVSIVKIDKLFVDNLKENSCELAMIEMLSALTHKIGGKVIVEGVESVQQLNILSRVKVDMLQGYLFSKPRNLADTLQLESENTFVHLTPHVYCHAELTAADVMEKDFIAISLDDRLRKVKQLFAQHPVDHLVVIENSQCQGIVTRAALFQALSPYINTKSEQHRDAVTLNKRAHQIMEKSPKTMMTTSPIEQCSQWLLEHSQDIIIVTGSVDVCMGVITAKEMLRQLIPN
ncbi:EAL domain-containing protein [Motilimonas sp. 1_MG-2023]|uniref:EAL domain-containing protein n=1 Tax=Motilimonas sp. 1_MG-2023 TaxID=3062672 RepID=UPI0026E23937|nr:EAL domain-containing protein [Motilimonas sp. 1_MG-2023]MDO6524065.1 EAL domain-containing protein [Motilimonas sp. 1_MG-2023]